ncbi:MAG: ABC transporter ATP-binding protein [Nitrososphaerota archaeon]|nr:ABC transporter ATP-binding protein [Nitrososphaerota archaeon]
MSYLIIKKLSKKFGSRMILKNLTFEVKEGELFVLLGPSGCGKSTLLRCIAGLEKPDEGDILIEGKSVIHLPPHERGVSMVFQYYALYPHMTIYENISLGLKHSLKLPDSEIIQRVKTISGLLSISHLLNKRPSQISGGEAQRVSLARALVKEPKILLLDEPLSALDAKLRRDLRKEIKRIQKETGTTVLYVTHDQEEAMSIADRIGVMTNGEILQIGTPSEVYNNPINKYIASFIGDPPMNFLKMKIIYRNGNTYLKSEAFSYLLSKDVYEENLSNYNKEEVMVGVRPSDIKINKTSKYPEKEIEAIVILTKNVGDRNEVHTLAGNILLIAEVDVAESDFNVGERVYLELDEEKMKFFDCETERSLRES